MIRFFWLFVTRIWKILLYLPLIGDWESRRIAREFPPVLPLKETLNRILAGCSIARFGDGEIRLCLGHSLPFQRFDPVLQEKMLRILASAEQEKLLIGIPDYVPAPPNRSWRAAGTLLLAFFQKIFRCGKGNAPRRYTYYQWNWMQLWRFIRKHIAAKTYADPTVSRTVLFQQIPLETIRSIWKDRDVVFVVPKNGKFVNDERLFSNVRSAEYLYIKPADAFDDYDRILSESLQKEKGKLFFIAAGPTATVLAYDLHLAGYQALDFGHLPNCFHEFLGEKPAPEKLTAFGQIIR